MRGAIEYLKTIHTLCVAADKDCSKCKLGKQQKLRDTFCPRLTDPRCWDRDKIAKMVNKASLKDAD